MDQFAYSKTVSSYSIFKTPSLLVSHEGLLGWQVFFAWLYDAHLEVGSSCCLSLCREGGPCPAVLCSTHMALRVWACGLRPAQAYILALALSWESGRSWLIRNQKSWGCLWVCSSPLSWDQLVLSQYRLPLFLPTLVLLCWALKFLCPSSDLHFTLCS